MKIFCPTHLTPGPNTLEEFPSELRQWFTWSDEVAALLVGSGYVFSAVPTRTIRLDTGKTDYDYTYVVTLDHLRDHSVLHQVVRVAECLRELTPGSRIYLLTGLLGPEISTLVLHGFIASVRTALAALTVDPWAAIHSSPKAIGPMMGEFPLHADLYSGRNLLSVFDDVPNDPSGKSTFLSTSDFLQIIDSCNQLPAHQRRILRDLLIEQHTSDRFEEFYSTIYGNGSGFSRRPQPWTEQLMRLMRARLTAIKFHRGQGYLIDDRRWLHGRTAPSSGAIETRLHRLAYRTASDDRPMTVR